MRNSRLASEKSLAKRAISNNLTLHKGLNPKKQLGEESALTASLKTIRKFGMDNTSHVRLLGVERRKRA